MRCQLPPQPGRYDKATALFNDLSREDRRWWIALLSFANTRLGWHPPAAKGLLAHDATQDRRTYMHNPIAERWDGMLERMAQLQATTSEGLAARAMPLAQHSGIKPGTECYPFAFEPDDAEDVTGRLLHMLLTNALQMVTVSPKPDADLWATARVQSATCLDD